MNEKEWQEGVKPLGNSKKSRRSSTESLTVSVLKKYREGFEIKTEHGTIHLKCLLWIHDPFPKKSSKTDLLYKKGDILITNKDNYVYGIIKLKGEKPHKTIISAICCSGEIGRKGMEDFLNKAVSHFGVSRECRNYNAMIEYFRCLRGD